MFRTLVILCAAFLCGCASCPKGFECGPDGTVAYSVLVETEEPGCRIEVDGDYVGKSPVTLKVFADRDGTFHDFGSHEWVIKAYPTRESGGLVQVKRFSTGGIPFSREDRVPKHIYFDTQLDSVKPRERIDVNINRN